MDVYYQVGLYLCPRNLTQVLILARRMFYLRAMSQAHPSVFRSPSDSRWARWTLRITTGKETWLQLAQAGWNPTHPERQQFLLHGSSSRKQLLTHQQGQRDSVSLSVDNGLYCFAEYLHLQFVIIGRQLKGLASEFSLLDLHMEMGVMYSMTFLPALQLRDFFLYWHVGVWPCALWTVGSLCSS